MRRAFHVFLVFLVMLAAATGIELAGRINIKRTAPKEPVLAEELRDLTPPALRGKEKTPSPLATPPAVPPRSPGQPLPKPAVLDPGDRKPEPQPLPQLSDQEFYERFSGAVVQVFCKTTEELFAASGVIVNERGLVLTNAHVAEIVKKAGEENCQARRRNPAEAFAGVTIAFVADATPKIRGTDVAQRDFAFLRLRDAREPFGVASISMEEAGSGETLRTLGYPSEFLRSLAASVHSDLVFSVLRVDGFADLDGERATAEGYVFRGGLVLQEGSSGTALFRRDGQVVGIIFATTKGKTTEEREGVALMMPYIDRVMKLETGEGLMEFITTH